MTWKHLPNGHTDLESYLYSLAQEVGRSAQNTFSAGAPSAMSSGMTTASGSSKPELPMACLTMPRYGMTLKLSMVRPGAASSMSSPPASPASRSALPESNKPPMTSATVGLTPYALLEKSSQPSAYWRMYQDSLLSLMGILEPSLKTWPKAGMMRGGVCYLQPKWEHRISAIGSGLSLYEMGMYPTPKAWDGEMGTPRTSGRPIERVTHLGTAARYWPTPQARDGDNRGAQAKRYWNPAKSNDLPDAVAARGHSGQLNPPWVAWLMGWPIGWTALKPLAMGKFRKWLQQHGDYLPPTWGNE